MIVAGACLAVISLAVELEPGAASPTRDDPNDAKGPLDLAAAHLHQHGRGVLLRLRFHEAVPSLGKLKRFPSRVAADDQRYLCLALAGRRLGRRLLCPGGKTGKRRVAVGVSSYGNAGAATARDRVRARISRNAGSRLELRFRLADLPRGRLRWAILSGWTGPGCAPHRPADERRRRGRERSTGLDRPAASPCLDREPDSGFAKVRLVDVRRVACTPASPPVSWSGSTSGKQIALTFDDGPSAYTARVVRILDRAGARGTFFEVGTAIAGRGAVMRTALENGHELANHAMRHEAHPSYASLRETSARIEAATGFRPCAFRPAGGALNQDVVGAAASNGMSTVLWDVDTRDWSLPGPAAIYRRAVAGAHPGAIIVMHDGGGYRAQTVAALPRIIRALRSRGYELVTVTEILGERFIFEEDR